MKSLWLFLIPVALAGCASGKGSDDYTRTEARQVYEVKMGVVESVRVVKMEGTSSGAGRIAGGAAGGIAGSQTGHGAGAAIGAIVGAVAGGIAGAAGEEAITRSRALEISVQLEYGRIVAIVQQDNGEVFNKGDHVRLLEANGQVRVTH